jgi:predicted nuclease of predicted toxin-antitoxin system
MKLLIDMNLSPQWVSALGKAGWEAIHWSLVGRPNASDREIFDYATSHGYVVFTNDLDFGAILAATNADYPSVIQIRAEDVTPEHLFDLVVSALHQFTEYLDEGALITVDDRKFRARILPLRTK